MTTIFRPTNTLERKGVICFTTLLACRHKACSSPPRTVPMYSHIIFDLDGTLVESLPGIASALNAALTGLSLPTHGDAIVLSFIGDGARTLCKRAAQDQSDDVVEALYASFMQEYPKTWKNGTLVYAGIQDLISTLKEKQCTLSILSNKPHDFTVEMVDYFFPEKPFDLVVGQREGISQKPDPSGVHELLGDLGQSSAKTILVGDSTIDVVTARNAGINSAAVTWGYHDKAKLAAVTPKHTAQTIEQLLEILSPKNSPIFR